MMSVEIIILAGTTAATLCGVAWLADLRRQSIVDMAVDALYWMANTMHSIACAASSAVATYRAHKTRWTQVADQEVDVK